MISANIERITFDTPDYLSELKSTGYVIVPNAISSQVLDRINNDLEPHFSETNFGTGHFYGEKTKRFGQLLNRSPSSVDIIEHKTIRSIVDGILLPNASSVQLNLTQGIEIHSHAPAQVPHRDQDMWGGEKGCMEYMVNVMWALSDFTAENGATRIWGKSHLGDQNAVLPDEDAIFAEMPAGSACLFLGSTLHSGGANRTKSVRRGIIVSYCLGWLKPWENQWLVYPPDVASHFPPELAKTVGYQQHLPSLGNVEGHCPAQLLTTAKEEPFVDALTSQQQELMRQYNEAQGILTEPSID